MKVRTVLGDVPADRLGVVDAHDHLFLASPRLPGEELDDPMAAAAELRAFAELGGTTWTSAWEAWITKLDASLAERGIPLIPNVGSLVTKWDDTDYGLTAGAFSEGFAQPGS